MLVVYVSSLHLLFHLSATGMNLSFVVNPFVTEESETKEE